MFKLWPFKSNSAHPAPATLQDPSPTKRALLIGIDDYPNLSKELQLRGCGNDLTLLSNLLSKRFEFPTNNISFLRNKHATREGILKAFQELVKVVQKDDVVVVQYSGHGSYMPDESKGSGWTETIVPYDSGRRPSNRPSTDIKDVEIFKSLLEPLIGKTPFVTLLFDSCHSGSILRDEFDMAIRGIKPDGELGNYRSMANDLGSGWMPDLTRERYALLAACRANEGAAEISIAGTRYGAFTYYLCTLVKEGYSGEIRTLFQLASTKVTAHYPNQHPILEGAQNASIFGATRLETPRYLIVRHTYDTGGTKMLEIDGGVASGVTQDSTWAVRPVDAPPGDTDALISVEEVLPFVSRAKVTRPGVIGAGFGCFEISHVYGEAALKVFLDDQDPRFEGFLSQLHNSGVSGTLNTVTDREVSAFDVRLVFLEKRSTVSKGDLVPQLGPLEKETCLALSPDGGLLLPPNMKLSDVCENLRKLARYRFGLGLRNLDQNNRLRGKLNLELKWRPSGSPLDDPWQSVRMGEDGFPLFQNEDHIACVITNNSAVRVWPYVLEFAEDGSVWQRYPGRGGDELLASRSNTSEVAQLGLQISSNKAFQLAKHRVSKIEDGSRIGNPAKKRVTEVLKLFASTEPVDLSLLLQTSFTPQREDTPGLRDLLERQSRLGFLLDDHNVTAWETVERPFVVEYSETDGTT